MGEPINNMLINLEVPQSIERAQLVALLREALTRNSAAALVELNKIIKDVRSL